MRLAIVLLALSSLIASCERATTGSESMSFTARIGGQPHSLQPPATCVLNQFNTDESPQWLFSFELVDGQGVLHVGLAAGDHRPGPRDVLFVLLNHGDASFSRVLNGRTELTRIEPSGDGWRVSGRLELALQGSSMASGRPEAREIRVEDGEFRAIECIAPAATPSH